MNSNDSNDVPISEPDRPPMSARVPERVGRGVYSTGQLILDSPKEFVIDFLQGLTRPPHVAARVIVTPATMAEFIMAFRENLAGYTRAFGPAPAPVTPPPQQRPTIEEIYQNFKLADDQLCGNYANSVLIGHSQTEFFFDFITSFYPHPAVSARVLIAAGQAPRLLTMLQNCLEQYQARWTPKPPDSGANQPI